ncbi:MAG: hypothetical protein K8F25_15120 [Fimbriimonadaceae bacterium]|nr:hypothetical protein [Alphaproteobacteria bacterium]
MKRPGKFLGTALVLAGMTLAAPAWSADQPLSADELQSMITDVNVAFSGKGISGVSNYRLDGHVRTELNIGFSDEGKWWIDGSQVCEQWQRLRHGKPMCFMIYPESGGTYRTSHGYSVRAL